MATIPRILRKINRRRKRRAAARALAKRIARKLPNSRTEAQRERRRERLWAARREVTQHNKALVRLLGILAKLRRKNRGRMSRHFHVSEFRCRDGTPVPKFAYPALRALCRDYLEPVRRQYGPISITSGYRHEAYNRSIGGASLSLHRYELHRDAVAADSVSAGASPPTVQAFHEKHTNPDGLGYYGGFTHVDNRNRVGMADARWSGAG